MSHMNWDEEHRRDPNTLGLRYAVASEAWTKYTNQKVLLPLSAGFAALSFAAYVLDFSLLTFGFGGISAFSLAAAGFRFFVSKQTIRDSMPENYIEGRSRSLN